MNGPTSWFVGERDEYDEQHERCGDEPVGVACRIDVLEVNLTWLVDLIDELRVKVSRDNGDACFDVHDMTHGGTRGTKGLD